MDGALAALGPVTPENVAWGVELQLLHFKAAVDRRRAAWRRLPPEFRKQVVAELEKLDHGEDDWVWKAVEELDLWPKS